MVEGDGNGKERLATALQKVLRMQALEHVLQTRIHVKFGGQLRPTFDRKGSQSWDTFTANRLLPDEARCHRHDC